MDALVTDVHNRSAVAGLRGLGRAGIEAVAVGRSRGAAGRWSRYARGRAVAPDPAADPDGFAACVAEIARRHGSRVVYPATDLAVKALLEASDTDELLPYGDRAAVMTLMDKHALAGLASAAGLLSPGALVEGTAAELADADLPLPVIVKPRLPGSALRSARHIERDEDLWSVLRPLPPEAPLIAQEAVSGPLMSLAVVVDRRGRVTARFQQRATRIWPRGAGPSSAAVGVAPDESLVRDAVRLLAAVGYAGLAQLQFVGTERGPALIDVNPRYYGSLPLALASGVNLPAAWHRAALDLPSPPLDSYRVGVSYRWLEADLSAAVRGSPRVMLARAAPPRVGAMWAGDDPLTAMLLAGAAVGARIRRRLPQPGASRDSAP